MNVFRDGRFLTWIIVVVLLSTTTLIGLGLLSEDNITVKYTRGEAASATRVEVQKLSNNAPEMYTAKNIQDLKDWSAMNKQAATQAVKYAEHIQNAAAYDQTKKLSLAVERLGSISTWKQGQKWRALVSANIVSTEKTIIAFKNR